MDMCIIKLKIGYPNVLRMLKNELMYNSIDYEHSEKKNTITIYYDSKDDRKNRLIQSLIWFYDVTIDNIEYDSFMTIGIHDEKQHKIDDFINGDKNE